MYVRRASLWYDARIVGRTVWVIVSTLLGQRRFSDPPELAEALRLLAESAVAMSRDGNRSARAQRPSGKL